MDLGLISVRYARALLKAGIEASVSDRVYSDMLTVLESYAKVPQLKATIDNPMLSRQQKEGLADSCGRRRSMRTHTYVLRTRTEGGA